MARSFNRLPITGNCKCRSEKSDKITWHRRLRRRVRIALYRGDDIMPHRFDVSNVWLFGKDGKTYYDESRLVARDIAMYAMFGK